MRAEPFVIGHAAAAGEAPANTLAGVRRCLDASADGMEIDVQLTADGVPVLMHDTTVDRTTNLRGPLAHLSFAELQGSDAGNGEPVPSLDQVLDAVAGRLVVMCELKSTPGDPARDERCVDAVAAVIRQHGAERWTAVHSFNPEMVGRARRAGPRVSCALIVPPVTHEALDAAMDQVLIRGGQAVSLEQHCVDAAAVARARQRQLRMWSWTADLPEDWARLRAAGVDGIITNVPGSLRRWLEAAPGEDATSAR